MSSPLQFLSHSDPGRLATGQTKEPREAKPSEARHRSAPTAQKNPPGVPNRNPNMYNKRAVDPARPELAGLLVKNKNLIAELRNLQNKLFAKETSLREVQSELEIYREHNAQQMFQIMSLKEDINDLQELIASLSRIKSLKNTNIQSLERGNWDLTERIIGLENSLRVHLVEREKAERKADLLERKLSDAGRLTPYLNTKGQEDSLDIFAVKDKGEALLAKNFERDIFHSEGPKDGQKIWEKCQQDLIHKEKQTPELDRCPYPCAWGTDAGQSQYQQLLGQLATLLSDSVGPIAATEDAVKERIQEIGANEQSWKSRTEDLQQEIQWLTKQLAQLHPLGEDVAQEPSPSEENYWEQNRPLRRLEGKIDINDFFQQKLDLDRKKENPMGKNSQRDEQGKKFRQLEEDYKQQMLLTIRQNLQIATTQKLEEKIQKLQKQLSDLKLSNKNMKTQLTRVNALKLVDFRETIMKMLGFNMKTANKEIINQLKLIIQIYEISNKPKTAPDGDSGQEKE